jgi:hypothetical protein
VAPRGLAVVGTHQQEVMVALEVVAVVAMVVVAPRMVKDRWCHKIVNLKCTIRTNSFNWLLCRWKISL